MNKSNYIKRNYVNIKLFDILNVVFLSLAVLVTVYPFWHEFCVSLSIKSEAMKGGLYLLPRGFTTASYHKILTSQYIYVAFKNSTIITVVGTFLSVLFSSAFAYFLSKKGVPGRKFFTGFVLFALLFDGGLIPTYLVVKGAGLVNSLWALIVLAVVAPYNIIVMKSFFESLPQELEESAFIDGANPFIIFFKIVLPLSKAVLATVAVWASVGLWNDYMRGLMYLNDRSKYVLPVLIRDIIIGQSAAVEQSAMIETTSETVIAATIVVALAPILMVYPFLQKYFSKGVMIGAVKG